MPFTFTVFHKSLRSTPFKLCIPFLYETPSSALGHLVTPLPMLSPVISTQCLQHSSKAVQNIMTQMAYEHVNKSFFIHCHIKIEITSLMQSLTDHYSENQLVNSSHSGVVPHSTPVILVFTKQFFPLDFRLAASTALP
jgi:hypothetical protein